MYNKKPLKEMTKEERREYNRERSRAFDERHKNDKLDPEKIQEKKLKMQQKKFKRRQQEIKEGKRKELNKSDIPVYERCEGFDELWNMVYMQVLSYWDEVPKSRSKYNLDKPPKIKR